LPYIPQEQRAQLNQAVDTLTDVFVNSVLDDETANYEGMINYAFTRLMMNVYGEADSTRYSNINNAIGVLECCKMELYRKVAGPYEDRKQHENGAVVARDDSELLDTITINVQQNGGESGAPSMEDMPEDVKEAMGIPKEDVVVSKEHGREFEGVADPRLSLKERTEAESEALFNPPVIKVAPNPSTNAGYGEGEFGDGEDL
jgi:hypothetical protein